MNDARRRIAACLLVALPGAPAWAACVEATEDMPRTCSSRLPGVAAVAVTEDRLPSAPDAERWADCQRFRVTAATVRRFVARARQVDDPRGEAALDRGPCHALGSLRFADGRRATWRLDQAGTMTLAFEDGDPSVNLVCARCAGAPFR
ncbi:hypothetical protein CLD22_14600 [Rubrivivax gelatinosus]|nr:hypothetical protein [Rubrivivax gelatinosus]